MIKIKKIKYRNFLSTGDNFSEIILNDSPNTLIVGENGSGKSTILDALCFALFGKAFRNIVKGSLINSVNEKNCLVELEFSANNKEYKICRGLKPTVFEIYCNDVLLNQDAASKDYQEYLEKNILKMTYKSFTQIVILGSSSYSPFMQLKPADRRIIIEDLLDIEIFSVMNSIVKNKLQVNREEIIKNGGTLGSQKEKLELIRKTVGSLTKISDKNLSALQDKKTNYLIEIDKINVDIKEGEKNKNKLVDMSSNLPKIKTKITDIIVMKTQATGDLNRHTEHISFFDTHDNCPTCKQDIDEKFKEKTVREHTKKKKKLIDGIGIIDKKLTELENDVILLNTYVSEIEALNKDLSVYYSKLTSLHSSIQDIDKEMKNLDSSNTMLEDYKAALVNIKEEIKNTELAREELLQGKNYIDTAILLLKDGGIKTKIIKQYLPIINNTINKYLTQMGFFVNFNINENFEETIKSRYRDEFSYHSFSEGEKFRIDLAILMTWRHIARLRNSVNCNLLIFDEIFDSSLDMNGIDEFLKIMWSLFDTTNVFVISHKADMMVDKFKKVYKFKKIKNFSIVE